MFRTAFLLLLTVLLSACTSTPGSTPNRLATLGMVATANPLASKAGADVLRAGGSAVDAAIAIEAVLSLVEPQSSGLAGGAFMVHFDNASKKLDVYDGREAAPSGATESMFLNQEGKSIGFLNAKNSGLSTGVPGVVAMLALAHEDHGKLPWGAQFSNASELANQGFAISPRLAGMIARFGKYIPSTEKEGPTDAYRYFFNADGQAKVAGDILINKPYAKTLDIISKDPSAFYRGSIAKEIVAQTATLPRAGTLSMDDLANYRSLKKEALCAPYKNKVLCGPPPASSWVAVAEIMGLLEQGKPFTAGGSDDAANWVMFAQAQRLAYADRDQYVADNQFVEVPIEGLLNNQYLKRRASEIGGNKAADKVLPGDPWAFENNKKVAYGKDATNDMAGTTHFVVVDGDGNVVSMTASVESIFGSTRMAGGMFLNNQLTDFSFQPIDDAGKVIANKVAPSKRPRSSMSPTIVLDENGEFLMATGSPGGNSIIAYTAKTLVGVLEWGLSPQAAVDLPNLVARGDKVRIEQSRASDKLISGLRDFGFNVKESAGENSGLSVILRKADGSLEGGVDSRREGVIEIVKFD